MVMTEDEAKLWLDGPIVRHVRASYGPKDVLELLEGVHLVCTELEERFPGIPFRNILSTSEVASPWETLRALRGASVAADTIAAVLGRFTYVKPTSAPGVAARFDTYTDEFMADICVHGHDRHVLEDHGYTFGMAQDMHFAWKLAQPDAVLLAGYAGRQAVRRRLEKQPDWDEMVRLVICEDLPMRDAAVRANTSTATLSKVCLAFLYQLWLATERALP